MIGYKSDMMWLPDHNVGAVILTNADAGGAMLGPFRRKLLEVLFDGRAEADADIATRGQGHARADSRRAEAADRAGGGRRRRRAGDRSTRTRRWARFR